MRKTIILSAIVACSRVIIFSFRCESHCRGDNLVAERGWWTAVRQPRSDSFGPPEIGIDRLLEKHRKFRTVRLNFQIAYSTIRSAYSRTFDKDRNRISSTFRLEFQSVQRFKKFGFRQRSADNRSQLQIQEFPSSVVYCK